MKTTDTAPTGVETPGSPGGSGPVVTKATVATPRKGSRSEGATLNVFSHGVLIIWAIMVVMPLLWAVMTSFKTDKAIFTSPWALPDRRVSRPPNGEIRARGS